MGLVSVFCFKFYFLYSFYKFYGVELYLADNLAYLKELAGLPDTSSEEEEEVQRKTVRSKSSSPVRFRRGQSYHDEGELKRGC